MNYEKINPRTIVAVFVGSMLLFVFIAKTATAGATIVKKGNQPVNSHGSATEFIFFEVVAERMLNSVCK